MKLKKGDQVMVISGKSRGKSGKIEKIISEKNQAVVAGINIAKKSVKPSKKAPKGGQIEFPAAIHISNLKYFCANCNKPTKVIIKQDSGKKKVRICKNCKNDSDQTVKTSKQKA
jgi:large subunit ribosomal protein L24